MPRRDPCVHELPVGVVFVHVVHFEYEFEPVYWFLCVVVDFVVLFDVVLYDVHGVFVFEFGACERDGFFERDGLFVYVLFHGDEYWLQLVAYVWVVFVVWFEYFEYDVGKFPPVYFGFEFGVVTYDVAYVFPYSVSHELWTSVFVHDAPDCIQRYGFFGVVEELVYDAHDVFDVDDALCFAFVFDRGLHAFVGDAFVSNLHVSQ